MSDFEQTMSDDVLSAMERLEINDARMKFLKYVDEITGKEIFPTNYYDQVLIGALSSIVKSGNANHENVSRLVDLYCEFVDALMPFQPSPEYVRQAANAPLAPWEPPLPTVDSGRIFYFIPCSGGYWVENSANIRKQFIPIINALALKCA